MSKGVAVHTIFLISGMSLLLIFTIISFWFFIEWNGVETNKATCTAKYVNYCERWVLKGDDPGDWNEIEPEDCERYDIRRPDNLEECKNII